MNAPLKVVVAGSTFGQFYLAALARLPEHFELVAMIGKGSQRSRDCAARHDVPLFTDPAQLPEDVDLGCVAVRSSVMGGAGTELSQALLTRGITVVQEHPVHHDDVAACLRTARTHGAGYQLGDLYPQLPAVRRFVAAAHVARAAGPITHVDAACSVQVAFPLVHILSRALGALRPWRFSPATSAGGPFDVVTGVVAGIPLILRVHNEVDPTDPDNHIHLLHRITLGTASGSLTLTDTHGPVTWNPRLHIPDTVKDAFDFDDPRSAHLGEAGTTFLGPSTVPDYRHLLSRVWPAAIGADLLAAADDRSRAVRAPAHAQQLLSACRMWQDLTEALGYPTLRPGQTHNPLPVGALTAAVARIGNN
ncbi:Gfo/Idh/MocA family oxidoreductase [Nocardia sp. NPDC058658]|uniref:Gfo/Idh/MocA family oxidoreductase n=1 Tax=Nocardia sp. NPDC058658 TaxID=3346580 RepID=UPI00366073E0